MPSGGTPAHHESAPAVSDATTSDAGLVARWRAGDPSAFEHLMRRHFESMWAVALGVAGNPDDAEDVCQEAMVRCWERSTQCREPERFRGWLLAITRRVGLTHRRRRRPRQSIHDDPPASTGALPDRCAEVAELGEILNAGLQTLGARERAVLLLRDLDGWPHADIAAHLGISETMSRRHLSDARKAMRAISTTV